MYLQRQPYGCGIYSVANALCLDNFVTESRIEESKAGTNIGNLAVYLQEDEKDLYVDVLYMNCFGGKLPNDILTMRAEREGAAIPLLLNVTTKEDTKNHLVGIYLTHTGVVLVMDSLKEKPYASTLSKINNDYFSVFGIFDFVQLSNSNRIDFDLSELPKERIQLLDEYLNQV